MAGQKQNQFYDASGRLLRLGARLGGGGEGTVFALADAPDRAIKIYHRAPQSTKASKIIAMTKLANERLIALSAWPLETIHTAPNGPLVGFTMPNATARKPIIELYSPKRRLQEFPNAGWSFLIHCAANTARAFQVTHESGTVIGDVNHSNLLIAHDATVKLIDCDSFQVRVDGQQWLCEVGVPEFQPPELQGVNFSSTSRLPNHDNFGLAVLIFLLLFVGRHPFIGQYLGTGDMPVDKAIREYRFAYGANATTMLMRPPPGSLRIDCIPSSLGQLFERAFFRQGALPNGRPVCQEWISALQELRSNLKKCSSNHAHQFYSALSKCPWCEIEAYAGFALFPIRVVGPPGATVFNIATLWLRVQSVSKLGPGSPLPNPASVKSAPSAAALKIRRSRVIRAATAAFLPVLYFAAASLLSGQANLFALAITAIAMGALTFGGHRGTLRAQQDRIKVASEQWNRIEQQWAADVADKAFDDEFANLDRARAAYEQLPQERLRKLQELELNRHAAQKKAFLDRCYLANAQIKGIGEGRKQILLAHNIETAADIEAHRVMAITGFGETLAANLLEWRHKQEAKFKFDPARGVSSADKAKVEQAILFEKNRLEAILNQGSAQLTAINQRVSARRNLIKVEAERVCTELAEATADARVAQARVPIVFQFCAAAVIYVVGWQFISSHQGLTLPQAMPVPTTDQSTSSSQESSMSLGTPSGAVMTDEHSSSPQASQNPSTSSPQAAGVINNQGGDSRSAPHQQLDTAPVRESGPSALDEVGIPNARSDRSRLPKELTNIISPSDWTYVLSAIEASRKLDPTAAAGWQNDVNGHQGFVTRADSRLNGSECARYRIARQIGKTTRFGVVEICGGGAH